MIDQLWYGLAFVFFLGCCVGFGVGYQVAKISYLKAITRLSHAGKLIIHEEENEDGRMH